MSEHLGRRLSLDIDDVIADFTRGFFRKMGLAEEKIEPAWRNPRDYWYSWLIPQTEATPEASFAKVFAEIKQDDEFWLNLPALERVVPPGIEFYLTSRECHNGITEQWLAKNGLPPLQVINTFDEHKTKHQICLERGITGHIDDKAETFEDCIKAGLKDSFLTSRPWNVDVQTPNRIYCLEELWWR